MVHPRACQRDPQRRFSSDNSCLAAITSPVPLITGARLAATTVIVNAGKAVLAVPSDYPLTLGLTEAVSPLRIRGMSGLLGRTQRQVRERIAA